ncbi:hypothetical protein AOLI_G00039980 [Acnodon oligacanthus]
MLCPPKLQLLLETARAEPLVAEVKVKATKITIEESSDDDDDEEKRSHSVRDIGEGLLSTKPSVSLLFERELPPTPIQGNSTDLFKWLGTFFFH